ncbi:hypothetical protein FACS1894103_7340 [Campylobacterota bacterium]|nr:hypothetical protein FACS1894103_7340 [Campylobacterota bacterium]
MMTARVSYSFDSAFANDLKELASELGKKPTQIIREAFEDYRDAAIVNRDIQLYEAGKLETFSLDEVRRQINAKG